MSIYMGQRSSILAMCPAHLNRPLYGTRRRRRSGVGGGSMPVVRSQSAFMCTSAVLRQRASAAAVSMFVITWDRWDRHEHRNTFSIYNPNLVPRFYELPGIKIQNDLNEHNKHVTTTQIRTATARWASWEWSVVCTTAGIGWLAARRLASIMVIIPIRWKRSPKVETVLLNGW